jgi:hypothetical protein
MKRIIFTVLSVFSFVYAVGQPGNAADKVKKVEKKPYKFEYPSNPLLSDNTELEEPWVVYSDRNDNQIYSDNSLSKVVSKVQFLDSFFVASIDGEAFELIKYNKYVLKNINKIGDPAKLDYVGWIDRSRLIVNDNSLMQSSTRLPYKFVTMLNGNKVFDNFKKYADGTKLKIYSDPNLAVEYTKASVGFNEIVYVYRQQMDKVLIGKKPEFTPGNAKSVVIGWVPVGLVQSWGTRLCIEPVKTNEKDVYNTVVFPSQEQALNSKLHASIAIPLERTGCEPEEQMWAKSPVFNISLHKGTDGVTRKLLQSGVVLNPFNKKEAYIYNVNGAKINYTKLCELIESSHKTNIVFALNMSNDTKEYMAVLIQTLQDLDTYFGSGFEDQEVKFGFLNCAENVASPVLHSSYNEVMHPMINLVKESVALKKTASPAGILNGLTAANNFFKTREKENNIVIMISSQADEGSADAAYKTRSVKVSEDLAKQNARVIFFQPYSGNGNNYAPLVTQAKYVLEKSSEKAVVCKRENHVGDKNEVTYTNTFNSLETGSTNIYCLDFPENSISQGFLVFPTVGNKTEGKFLSKAIDSLLAQIDADNKHTIGSMTSVFNSPGIFNAKPDAHFERYYRFYEMVPKDLEVQTKNINFNYFASGFTISPANATRYYKHSLLLSKDEYNELWQLFKSLKFDLVSQTPTEANKTNCYNALMKALNTYSVKTGNLQNRNVSLANFFWETCGYYTNNPVLYKFNMQHLITGMTISRDEFSALFLELNKVTARFYSLANNKKYIFWSNGMQYYWVNEEFLP